jgi:dTDP-glucose pyrophosphorylase
MHDLLITRTATLRDALAAIDLGLVRTVFVVDGEQHLLGSVCDGDIRRALLAGLSLGDSVSQIMNPNPRSANEHAAASECRRLLLENDLQCLPIVSHDNIVLDVATLKSLETPKKRHNVVFIMAGGFGKRLAPLTDRCPKPMLLVGDKPMLQHLIERLSYLGFSDFYISTHYLPEVITNHFGDGSDWGVNISYVHEDSPLGTGGALSLLPSGLTELPILVLNGDILSDLDFGAFLDFHISNEFDATMCLREVEHRVSFGVVESKNGRVTGMAEKPTFKHDINAGMYVINPSLVNYAGHNCKIDMPMLLEEVIEEGKVVGCFRYFGYWLDIGSSKDYERAQKDIGEVLRKFEN